MVSRVGGQYLALLLVLLVFWGCFRQEEKPFDNDVLYLIARGRFFSAWLEKCPDPHGIEVRDEATARELLRSLLPITSVKVGHLATDAVDYKFIYQSGSNPIEFLIDVSHDHLVFQASKWVYEGGDTEEFESLADKILGTEKGVRPNTQPTESSG